MLQSFLYFYGKIRLERSSTLCRRRDFILQPRRCQQVARYAIYLAAWKNIISQTPIKMLYTITLVPSNASMTILNFLNFFIYKEKCKYFFTYKRQKINIKNHCLMYTELKKKKKSSVYILV